MKKLLFALLLIPAMLCAACGSSATSAAPASSAQAVQQEAAMNNNNNNMVQISIEGSGKRFTGELEQNALTKQFIAKLPRTLHMTRLNSDVIYGDDPISMPGSLVHGLKKGDLAYCQYGYFIIFTADQPASHTTGFIKVGRITSGNLNDLDALAGGGDVSYALIK